VLLASVVVLFGALLGVGIQAGVSLPAVLPQNEDLARGGLDSEGAPGPDALDVLGERTELPREETSPREADSASKSSGGEGEKEKPEPPPASEEPLNVLVLGVDRRPSAAEDSSSRSDTIMLAQVTPKTGRVELLSVPRDLFVEVGPGVEDRINTAYAYGGVEQAKAAMENLTGVPIDAHAIIDFQGFEDVIEAIGGVEVDVEDEIPPKYKIEDGLQTLDGEQALFYARYRGTSGGDLDRIERQQNLLTALRSKMLAWNTFTKMPAMLKIANENVDTDLGLLQAISLGRALATNGGKDDLKTVQLKGYPETLSSGAQVLIPDQQANEAVLADFRE
jgi:LCP family protein required for cell wall assembly